MTLRDRCKQFYQKAQQDAMLRQGSPVDDLVAFVLLEINHAKADGYKEVATLLHGTADEIRALAKEPTT